METDCPSSISLLITQQLLPATDFQQQNNPAQSSIIGFKVASGHC